MSNMSPHSPQAWNPGRPSDDLADLSATETARLIRAKEVSPVEVVEAALARIERHAPLNAFITVTADRARAQAQLAEQAVMRGDALGPLHGVPYSVKDLTLTAGVRTTMGSPIFEHFVPEQDAVAVRSAQAAGAILVGKTNTPEFGARQMASSPLNGRTLHPTHPQYTPGASSSGAAVAVATGQGLVALGTDGGGSIRIPASCCGIVGFKATLGAVPNLQPGDLFTANSYVGPMARNVADTALLFAAIRGRHSLDPWGQAQPVGRTAPATLKGLRVAWLPTCGNRIDPEVLNSTQAAMRALEDQGATVETVDIDFVSLERHFLVLLETLTAARVAPHLSKFRDRMDPAVVAVVERGLQRSALELQEAHVARTRCFQDLQRVLERFDLLASPTVSAPPLHIDLNPEGLIEIDGQAKAAIRAAWYPYTYPMNLTGHPALSMPCGRSRIGLPIGLHLVGRWHDDDFLLGSAALLEPLLSA